MSLFKFLFGPTGRSILVDASGRLVATGDSNNGLYPFAFGDTGRTLVVDASGRLVLSPLSPGIGASGAGSSLTGNGTTNMVAKFTSTMELGDSIIYDNGTNVGIGTTTPSGKLTVVGSFGTPVSAVNINGATTINLALSNVFRCTLQASGSSVQFTNGQNGGKYTLFIQNSNGLGTINTWPSTFLWRGGSPPVITAVSGARDVVTFIYDSVDDSYYGDIGQNFI